MIHHQQRGLITNKRHVTPDGRLSFTAPANPEDRLHYC